MTAADLIKASIRLVGAYGPGETPPAEDIEDGLQALNMMLDSWSLDRPFIWALTRENFALTIGQASYTWVSGGNFNSARPLKVEGAYVRDSDGNDYFVEVHPDMNRYNRITGKTTQGRPYILFYDPQFSSGKVYLYYVPDKTYTLYTDAWKPVTQIAASTTALSFPPGYERALKYNLAIEIAPEYGVSVSDEVAYIAKESKKKIDNLNAPVIVARFDTEIPASANTGQTMNITTGE